MTHFYLLLSTNRMRLLLWCLPKNAPAPLLLWEGARYPLQEVAGSDNELFFPSTLPPQPDLHVRDSRTNCQLEGGLSPWGITGAKSINITNSLLVRHSKIYLAERRRKAFVMKISWRTWLTLTWEQTMELGARSSSSEHIKREFPKPGNTREDPDKDVAKLQNHQSD